jgi:hypothetical protein
MGDGGAVLREIFDVVECVEVDGERSSELSELSMALAKGWPQFECDDSDSCSAESRMNSWPGVVGGVVSPEGSCDVNDSSSSKSESESESKLTADDSFG